MVASCTVSFACCCAGAPYIDVKFGLQKNIVIWEPEKETEHFIRAAEFRSDAEKIGFLAPTPTIPKLSLVNPSAYRILRSRENSILNPSRSRDALSGLAGDGGGDSRGYEVLQEVSIGDYRAKTIRATDSMALSKYLTEEGFTLAPDAEEWIQHYVEKQWLITAFRVEKQSNSLQTGSICMSFKTDRPFNPAYVPKSNLGDAMAGFHLYFLSPVAAMAGQIGDRRVESPLQFELGRSTAAFNRAIEGAGIGSLDGYSVSVFDEKFNAEDRDDLLFTEFDWREWFQVPPTEHAAKQTVVARLSFFSFFSPHPLARPLPFLAKGSYPIHYLSGALLPSAQ